MKRCNQFDGRPFILTSLVMGVIACLILCIPGDANNLMVPNITPDKMTGVAIAIEYEHHEIHDGDAFTFSYVSTTTPTDIGSMTVLAFNSPAAADGRVHLIVDAHANDASSFYILEAPTMDLDEETVLDEPWNRHRASANTSSVTFVGAVPIADEISVLEWAEAATANITINADTTLYTETLALGAAAPFGATSNTLSRGQREFVLAPSTQYAVVLRNLTVNDTIHTITLHWYEHIDSGYIR